MNYPRHLYSFNNNRFPGHTSLYPGYHHVYGFPFYRQFPPVSAAFLIKSAQSANVLLNDVQRITNAIVHSKEFPEKLMSAAQASKTSQVNEMIRLTGVRKVPKFHFNPDGIILDFAGDENNNEISHIRVFLKWKSS
ncbi:hypothetical protein CVD28_21165 [Bacillus sp. M6-12]|uniref:hypothetical protein n=1 Tax=Bacillus sp. M6-12 TaxID=2054166 RepID=UPI000C75A745|nr:hypothetical protein [Bacillus sp. M6-12]PLS15675.1 hypothetical protein CVD28_21165 [Bacillus sp. M6-12]